MVALIKTVAAGLALLSSASASKITFINKGDVGRNIVHWAAKDHLHPNDPTKNFPDIAPIWIEPQQTIVLEYPHPWNGAFRSCKADQICHHPAVRGEICFGCFEGKNLFDVSAVDNHSDNTGIHWLRANDKPYDADGYSGCKVFPCPTCYLNPNDERTKPSTFANLTCEMWG